jgi:hypothetical protein
MAVKELYNTPLFTDPNLVAYYRLEDENDSKASYTMTNNGSCTFTTGKFANGVNFGSNNSSKSLRSTSDFGMTTGARSHSFWFKPLRTPQEGVPEVAMINIYTNGSNGVRYIWQWQKGGGITYWIPLVQRNAPYNPGFEATTFEIGRWFHVAITDSGSEQHIYLDGQELGNGTVSGVSADVKNTTCLGYGCNRAFNDFASCMVDDAALFNRVLTPTEVLMLYEGGWPVPTFSLPTFL